MFKYDETDKTMAVYGAEMLAEFREIYYTSLQTCEKLKSSLNKIEIILHQQDDLDFFFKSLGNEILCRMKNFKALAFQIENFPGPFIDVFDKIHGLEIFSLDGYLEKYGPDIDECDPYHLMGP